MERLSDLSARLPALRVEVELLSIAFGVRRSRHCEGRFQSSPRDSASGWRTRTCPRIPNLVAQQFAFVSFRVFRGQILVLLFIALCEDFRNARESTRLRKATARQARIDPNWKMQGAAVSSPPSLGTRRSASIVLLQIRVIRGCLLFLHQRIFASFAG